MRYRYINIFTLSLAAWAIIIAMVVTCNAVAGTRYEGVDSTDGRYWRIAEFCDTCTYQNGDAFIIGKVMRYAPRPEAWEMVRVDTVGGPCDSSVARVVGMDCLAADTIYHPMHILLDGASGPTYITGRQRTKLLWWLAMPITPADIPDSVEQNSYWEGR